MDIKEIDSFTKHYLIAALWSTNDESTPDGGKPLDGNYGLTDFAPEAVKRCYDDCQKFQQDNAALLSIAYAEYIASGLAGHPDAGSPEACAGHDYWLTRNGHGAGFWDRGLSVGNALSVASGRISVDPYVDDDGKIYVY